jgi:hypothetical protein
MAIPSHKIEIMETTVDLNKEPLETHNGVPLLPRKSGARPVTLQMVKDFLESEWPQMNANERECLTAPRFHDQEE